MFNASVMSTVSYGGGDFIACGFKINLCYALNDYVKHCNKY